MAASGVSGGGASARFARSRTFVGGREHPEDRAALQTLRAVPGFDHLIKRTLDMVGERGIRLMFQANAVRVEVDRAGLLDSQDPEASLSMFLKIAGGSITSKHELNVRAYARQIEEYEQSEGVDTVFSSCTCSTRAIRSTRSAPRERAREVKEIAKNLVEESSTTAKRAAREASDVAQRAVERLGEVLGRRGS